MSTGIVPTSIRRLINLYNTLSHNHNSPYAEQIESFLQNTSDSNLRNKRWSIVTKNARKGREWKVDRNRERCLFQDPIDFGPNELKKTKYLFKDQSPFTMKEGLLPKSLNARKNSSVYSVDIESTLNSFFNPLTTAPVHKSDQQTFKYYLQSLTRVPIMIFFKQKCDLLLSSSLDKWNQPYFDMRRRTQLENARFEEKKVIFNLTKVTRPDILSLALKSENYMKTTGQNFNKLVKNLPWDEVKLVDDKLVKLLEKEQQIKALARSNQQEVSHDDEKLLFAIDEATQMTKKNADVSTILETLPYKLHYYRFYMLEILNIDADFSSFESLWSDTDFEIVGARLALNDSRIGSLLQHLVTAEDLQHASSYEDILKLAKPEEVNVHGINNVIRTIASHGLVNTSLNSKKDSIYLTKMIE
ncbi:hypothetical protein CANMA_004286 [Candida margitis]|uniref:uncharacterized protein n=1 Tax=Candida margitis TaxID=1775924 RepID=UPI0022271556|nr:uncharacterized protein CANMA_004286 [Candida margitis]KAI5958132.1 hypothetical protein CANMA_004286 [Candida margitis]